MITQNNTMRVYIADLAEYNNGTLKGVWVDLPSADIHQEVKEMLGSNEEWAIHDYELPFSISEYEDLDELNTLAEQYQDLDDQDIKKINYLIDHTGADINEALDQYNLVDIYEDMSYEDLAYELVDSGCFGDMPDNALKNYIDYEAIGRDLSYDYVQIDNDLYRMD